MCEDVPLPPDQFLATDFPYIYAVYVYVGRPTQHKHKQHTQILTIIINRRMVNIKKKEIKILNKKAAILHLIHSFYSNIFIG